MALRSEPSGSSAARARCKVVRASGPVDEADSARVVQVVERALDELGSEGPLVVQIVSATEMEAFGHFGRLRQPP